MEFGDLDRVDDGNGYGNTYPAVSCTICLDIVTDNGVRSTATLKCGHQFHLDCIGSAFNLRGAMECPNCREIERGQWLYPNGPRSYAEFNMEDLVHDESPYDFSNSIMMFVVNRVPPHGYTRLPSSYDGGVLSSTAYHGLPGQHVEPTAVSSASHRWTYVAYSGQYSSSSHSSGSVYSNGSTFRTPWTNRPAPRSSRIAGPDQLPFPSMTQRVARDNIGMPRSGTFVHPSTVDHGSGISVAASMPPPYPDTAARSREHISRHPPGNSQGVDTPLLPSVRRSNGHVNRTQGEERFQWYELDFGTFLLTEREARELMQTQNYMRNRFHAWERGQYMSLPSSGGLRVSIWVPFHELLGAPDTGIRPYYIRRRHG